MCSHRRFDTGDIEQSIAARFERQVEEYPDRVAVKTDRRLLTYQDLNRASNRVAHAILGKRGDREEPVALLVDQGVAAVVALLGTLKAGKFYVPLDPSHPPARLASVVRDAEPSVILTDSAYRPLAAEIAQGSTALIDCDQLDSRDMSVDDPKLTLTADRTGYLFFTSGSTGRPKGVTQTQRNILHQIMSYTNGLMISADDRLTLLHSHAFSASRLDIFGALLNGAALFPFSVAEAGISRLTWWLQDQAITLSHWIPTLFRGFVNSLREDQRFPALRIIVLGSEPAVPRDVALFRKHFGAHCTLVNRYGTTETGNIRWLFVDERTILPSTVVPVGFPFPGADVYLIDEHGNTVEPGQVGEICVRSRYLSSGYWKNPELTRAVFLPDPDGGDNRTYLTGDMGRMGADGSLDHLGRRDSQIKIRGFRIERQEIETLLGQHPALKEAVVEVEKDGRGENRLVGYAVPFPGRAVHVDEINRYLAAALPHYMVPATIVFLDELPRTPHGKVDHLALRDASQNPISSTQSPAVPVDATEKTLTAIWAELLDRAAVGVRDNFFDLGGDSLLAVLLMVKIEKTFGRQLMPAAIFEAPTVEQLARMLGAGEAEPNLPSIVRTQPYGSRRPFFWIHGDWSNTFLPEFLGPDQPLYGLEHQAQDGKLANYTSVESIAEHYLRQIRQIQGQGPYLLGGYSFGGTIAFEIAQRLKRHQQGVALLVILDSLFPGPAAAPSEGEKRSDAAATAGRTSVHLERLARLGFRDRVAYLLVGVRNKANEVLGNRLDRIFKSLVCGVCVRAGLVLPRFVRSLYIQEIYKPALRNYSPKEYAGRAVYFRSMDRAGRHQESWHRLMMDGLEVYNVPGDHAEFIRKESAPTWVEQLRDCIARAQLEASTVVNESEGRLAETSASMLDAGPVGVSATSIKNELLAPEARQAQL